MLVERGNFVDALTALLDEAVRGHGRLAFLGGEAGVGKTSLLTAFVDSVADRVATRTGGCDSVATAAALGPFVEAFPELGAELAADRVNRLALVNRLREVLAGQPTLLLVEDVHWADEATLEMLRMLARRLTDLPALVVASFRTDDVPPDHPLTVLLGDSATSPGVVRMQVPPLTVDGVRDLAARAESPIDPAQLHESTGGNPFYVTEVLAERGLDSVPGSVRDAVLARAHRLSRAAYAVLGAAAVLGPRSPLELLTEVSGEPSDAVDECVRRGMLLADGHTLAFRHELARLAIEQTLAPGERVRLHRAALHALQRSPLGNDRRLAYHAAGCADPSVVQHAVPAARNAARLGAHREAAELYRLALAHLTPDDPQRRELCAALSYECYLTDQLAAAHAAQLEAMTAAQQAGALEQVGSSQRWLSRLSWFLGRNAESEQWALRSVATLEPHGETRELAMAYSNLGQLRMLADDVAGAVEWGERTIALARRLGDREVEIHAENNVGTALALTGDEARGLARLVRSMDMAMADDLPEHVARAHTNLGSIAVLNRRLPDADRQLRAGIAYCRDHDLDSWQLYMSAWLARSLAERGRFDAAEAAAREVLRHPQLSPITRITASVVVGQLAARRGRPDPSVLDSALSLAESTGEAQRLVPVAAARAEAAWLAGEPERIVAEVDRAWAAAIVHPQRWQLGELAWWLAVAGDRRPLPVELARPFALLLDSAWLAAAAAWRELDCPLWCAVALCRAPDLDDARAAVQDLEALGATAVRDAVLRDRHRDGLPVPRGPRAVTRGNPYGLTAREIDILGLLVAGLSNAELVERLFLSQKTVGHHVSAILRKLDVPTRSRAVALALQEGIAAQT